MKIVLITLLSLFCFATGMAQIEIGNEMMDYEMKFKGETLIMNGGGVRSMFFIDLYAGALYVTEKSSDPIAIAYADDSMAIHIKITSRLISREIMLSSIEDGFKKATDDNTKELESRIQKMRDFYVKELHAGDTIDLAYVKDLGVVCYFNKRELGVIEGQDFKFALFKIWLGEKPASKALKKGMLGKA